MNLGYNIKLIRSNWRFKQTQFGEMLGVPGPQIGKYESEENFPRLPALLKLVEITGIPFHDLCTRPLDISEIPSKPLEEYHPNEAKESIPDYRLEEDDTAVQLNKLKENLILYLEENRELRLANISLKEKNDALQKELDKIVGND